MKSGNARLWALIGASAALLSACGGGSTNSSEASVAPTAITPDSLGSWGTYNEADPGDPIDLPSRYQSLRLFRDPAGKVNAYLVIDWTSKKLVLLNPYTLATIASFDDGPTIDPVTSAAWVAPEYHDAGIVQIGTHLHRFEWDGRTASLSSPIYTFSPQAESIYETYSLASDDKSLVILDHLTLVMIAPNGRVTLKVDLLQVDGVSSSTYVDRISMNTRAVLLVIDRGLLSIDRETGQSQWLDHKEGSHNVKKILWASNSSTGYLVHLPELDQWHEQVIEVLPTGAKRTVADHIMAMSEFETEPEDRHKELGWLRINLSDLGPPHVQAHASTYRPATEPTLWCELPPLATEDQWTCKGNKVFAYNVAKRSQTFLGVLDTKVDHRTSIGMHTSSDVMAAFGYISVRGESTKAEDGSLSFVEESWQFSPEIENSLHWVSTSSTP